jgi:hypothetical protein
MRTKPKLLAALALLSALAAGSLGGAGCSTEQLTLTLGVSATPNPVTGVVDGATRLWEYRVSITNPHPVGVFVEYYHNSIAKTDTGYTQALQTEKAFALAGQRIAPGATLTYLASRDSEGRFSRGTERRIYHTLGDDGKYYSGEVLITLQ